MKSLILLMLVGCAVMGHPVKDSPIQPPSAEPPKTENGPLTGQIPAFIEPQAPGFDVSAISGRGIVEPRMENWETAPHDYDPSANGQFPADANEFSNKFEGIQLPLNDAQARTFFNQFGQNDGHDDRDHYDDRHFDDGSQDNDDGDEEENSINGEQNGSPDDRMPPPPYDGDETGRIFDPTTDFLHHGDMMEDGSFPVQPLSDMMPMGPMGGPMMPEMMPMGGPMMPEMMPMGGPMMPEMMPMGGPMMPEMMPMGGPMMPDMMPKGQMMGEPRLESVLNARPPGIEVPVTTEGPNSGTSESMPTTSGDIVVTKEEKQKGDTDLLFEVAQNLTNPVIAPKEIFYFIEKPSNATIPANDTEQFANALLN